MIGKMPAGNLLISAATLFCGQTFTNVDQFADYMNLNFIGKIYILHHTACVLMLAVEHTWNLFQKRILERGERCGTWSNRPTAKSPPPRQYHPLLFFVGSVLLITCITKCYFSTIIK